MLMLLLERSAREILDRHPGGRGQGRPPRIASIAVDSSKWSRIWRTLRELWDNPVIMDDALRTATQRLSALPFEGVDTLKEKKVVTPALVHQLERVTDEPVVTEQSIKVQGWLRQPGGTDVAIGAGTPFSAVAEVKVNDLEWSFYDLLKVASLVDAGTARAGYLVLCAKSSRSPRRSVHSPLYAPTIRPLRSNLCSPGTTEVGLNFCGTVPVGRRTSLPSLALRRSPEARSQASQAGNSERSASSPTVHAGLYFGTSHGRSAIHESPTSPDVELDPESDKHRAALGFDPESTVMRGLVRPNAQLHASIEGLPRRDRDLRPLASGHGQIWFSPVRCRRRGADRGRRVRRRVQNFAAS